MKKHAFPKKAKLCGQLRIEQLYKNGRNVVVAPLRFTFRKMDKDPSAEPVKVLVWAAKRLFKRANERNRIRRLIREAYRLNADIVKIPFAKTNETLLLAVNYIEKTELPYKTIETAMIQGLRLIVERLNRQKKSADNA